MTRRLLAVMALMVLSAQLSFAAESTTPLQGVREQPPRWHALINARVHVAPGQVVEQATVVLRDGRIQAVGTEVTAPAGARVWDVEGANVYAGFIEPSRPLGEMAPRPEGPGHWNPRITPERRAAGLPGVNGEAIDQLRGLGFALAQFTPAQGIFRGEGALAHLAPVQDGRLEAGTRVLDAPAVAHAAFEFGGWPNRDYPTSLMGSMALVRQALIDTRWHADIATRWARDPVSTRPERNLALEALRPVAAGNQRLLFGTRDELDYARIFGLAREFALDVAILGNGHEYRQASLLAEAGRPVVIPLAFPEVPPVERVETADDISLAALSHWELAASNAAFLAAADVEFSFTSTGLQRPAEAFWPALREAVRRGLAPEQALAGLTRHPARLLGVDDRLGEVRPGRLAYLTVFDGDPFTDPHARLRMTVIDGDPVPTESARREDPRGSWRLVHAEGSLEISITGPDRRLRVELDDGTRFDGRLDEGRLLLQPPAGIFGFEEGYARISAEPLAGRLEGLLALPDGRHLRIRGERTAPAPVAETREPTLPAPALVVPRYPAGAFGVAPEAHDEAPRNILFFNATVWTMGEQGVLDGAEVLVRDGRIAAVGRDLRAPRDVVRIDLEGHHLTPGLIDAHSHSAISGGVNEASDSNTTEVRIADVVDPTDIALYRQLAGGVTTIHLLHGSANTMGGQNAVIKLRWGQGAEAMRFAGAMPGVKFALGENVKQSNWASDGTRYPQTRMGVEQFLIDQFEAAREYGERMERARRTRGGVPPRRDLRMEATLEILRGERLVHIHSYRQDEILMFARLAETFGLQVGTFQHVLEGYKVADAIARIDAGASAFSDWWAFKAEAWDAIPHNVALMTRAGVLSSLNSDDNELARRLNTEAAKAVRHGGMDEEEAFALVTLNPARQLRIDDRVGALAPGLDADLVVWNAHPLSTFARVEQTWIDGRRVFDREQDLEARREVAAERERLMALALEAARQARPQAAASQPAANDAPGAAVQGVLRRLWLEHAEVHLHQYRDLYHDGSNALTCTAEHH